MEERKEYIKAFNHGYFLQEQNPTLARKIVTGFGQNNQTYREGFMAGIEEKKNERIRLLEHKLENERKQREQYRFKPRSEEKGRDYDS